MEALIINDRVTLPAADLTWKAVRASGPGGQNVNKVASKVELRFALSTTRALDPLVRQRLRMLAAGRLDADGDIVITSQAHRDQPRNLDDTRARLRELVLRALAPPPPPRRPTRPSRAVRERRLSEKKKTGARKRERRRDADD